MSDHAEFAHHRILITNDDGINAYGLTVLEAIARTMTDDVWVVAPELEQSGAGHGLTLSQPLRIRQLAEKRYAISGTPTDCVMMAVHEIIQDKRPTLVLSGVNRGGNLAEDVTYSGTIAGAMEGVLCKIPSIALSQAVGRDWKPEHFATAERFGPGLVQELVRTGWDSSVLLNINFPGLPPEQVKGVRVTRQGIRDESQVLVDKRIDARGFPYYWFGLRHTFGTPADGTDLQAVRAGYISVGPLHLDLTHEPSAALLAARFNNTF